MSELQAELNRLAGTTNLDAQKAANVLAGTSGLDLVGALNIAAGTYGLEFNGAIKSLSVYLGGASTDSNSALVTATISTAPYPPHTLTASGGAGSVTLNWSV